MRILGIDFGEKRIGISLSDETRTIAQPFKTISVSSKKQAIQEILKICEEKNVNEIVIGLPLNTDGTEGSMVEKVKNFAKFLEKVIKIPVHLYPEWFTSIEAEAILHKYNKKAGYNKDKIDRISATIILSTYLASIKENKIDQ